MGSSFRYRGDEDVGLMAWYARGFLTYVIVVLSTAPASGVIVLVVTGGRDRGWFPADPFGQVLATTLITDAFLLTVGLPVAAGFLTLVFRLWRRRDAVALRSSVMHS